MEPHHRRARPDGGAAGRKKSCPCARSPSAWPRRWTRRWSSPCPSPATRCCAGSDQIEHAAGQGRAAARPGGAPRRGAGGAADREPVGSRFPKRAALRGPDGGGGGAHAPVLRQGLFGDGHRLRVRFLPAGGHRRRGRAARGAGGAASARLSRPARARRRHGRRERGAHDARSAARGPAPRGGGTLRGDDGGGARGPVRAGAPARDARVAGGPAGGACPARRGGPPAAGDGARPLWRTAHGQRLAAGIVRRLPRLPHFLRYGLKPEIIEPYALTPRDEGRVLPRGGARLLREAMEDGDFDPERAEARMERVAETLLAPAARGAAGAERPHARRGKAAQGRGAHGGAPS